MALEIERKYLDINLHSLREALLKIGAATNGLHWEKNTLFDTESSCLEKRASILRLRLCQWKHEARYFLTYKSGAADAAREVTENLKIRNELEVEINNGAELELILEKLGYAPVACYEKFREEWKINWATEDGSNHPAIVDIDILPFGNVAEIESDMDTLNDVAMALGLDKLKTSIKSYHELHQEWLLANGQPQASGFRFSQDKLARLRLAAGLDC